MTEIGRPDPLEPEIDVIPSVDPVPAPLELPARPSSPAPEREPVPMIRTRAVRTEPIRAWRIWRLSDDGRARVADLRRPLDAGRGVHGRLPQPSAAGACLRLRCLRGDNARAGARVGRVGPGLSPVPRRARHGEPLGSCAPTPRGLPGRAGVSVRARAARTRARARSSSLRARYLVDVVGPVAPSFGPDHTGS